MITYFDKNTSNEREFICLIADYLITQKSLIEIDSALHFTSDTLFDSLLAEKNLVQFMRLFEEKSLYKSSKLNARLLAFLDETRLKESVLASDSILVELAFVAPFLFRHNAKVDKLMRDLVSFLADETRADLSKNTLSAGLETKTFVFSLSVWSTLMISKPSAESLNESVETVCGLLASLNKLKLLVKANTGNKYDQGFVDKCDNHLMRALNYYVVLTSSMRVKNSIESVIDVLKSRLSSPYHEVCCLL